MEQHRSPALAQDAPSYSESYSGEEFFRRLGAEPSVPPLRRGSMVALPWLGFVRGVRHMLRGRSIAQQPQGTWQRAAYWRRRVLLALIVLPTIAASTLMTKALPFAGAHAVSAGALGTALSGLQLLLFAVLFAWISAGFWSAVMGFYVSLRGDRHGLYAADLPRLPLDVQARTAIVMPICNEHVATVFAGLRAACESLAATGALALFDFYVLSDTRDEKILAEEYDAWIRLRVALGDQAQQGFRQGYGGARLLPRAAAAWQAQGRKSRRLLPSLGTQLPLHGGVRCR